MILVVTAPLAVTIVPNPLSSNESSTFFTESLAKSLNSQPITDANVLL